MTLPDGITVHTKLANSSFTNTEMIRGMISRMKCRRIVKYEMSLFEEISQEFLKKRKLLAYLCVEQFIEAWKLEYNDDVISQGQIDCVLRKYFNE